MWESLYIIPGGFGSGISQTSAFIALTSNTPHTDMAVATSGFFLAGNIGVALGISVSSSLQKWMLNSLLLKRLQGPDGKAIIEHVLSDVSYIKQLEAPLREKVIRSYVESLRYSHGNFIPLLHPNPIS
jgi:hypothetical protein